MWQCLQRQWLTQAVSRLWQLCPSACRSPEGFGGLLVLPEILKTQYKADEGSWTQA